MASVLRFSFSLEIGVRISSPQAAESLGHLEAPVLDFTTESLG